MTAAYSVAIGMIVVGLLLAAWLLWRIESTPLYDPWNGDIDDTANGHSDPVFYDSINRVWFFYDQTWTDVLGPFEDEELARAALDCYADRLDNGDDWRLNVRRRNAACLPATLFWEFLVPGTTKWEGPYASFQDAKASRDAYRRTLESHSAPGMYGASSEDEADRKSLIDAGRLDR